MHDEVRDRIDATFEDLGEKELKNIARPVRVFEVQSAEASSALAKNNSSRAAPLLPAAAEQPSLAVLPFVNMSDDPEQEYFADGITEEIITALSRMKWFFVIARNSSFTYKGRSIDVRSIGHELGVRYVLEGSVRRAGSRLRVTGQLVETETGHHVWADKFDGDLADVISLQDQVAEAVAATMEPSLRRAELIRSRRRPTDNLDAYDFLLRALPNIMTVTTLAANDEAISNLKQAAALDPTFAQAYGLLGTTHALRKGQNWSTPDSEKEGTEAADRAVALQSEDPIACAAAGLAIAFLAKRMPEALELVERAYSLNPNSARVLLGCGWVNFYCGRDQVAIDRFERHLRLSPIDPEAGYIFSGLSMSLFAMRRFEEGIAMGRRAVATSPAWTSSYRALIINLVAAGLIDEAKPMLRTLLRLSPKLTIRTIPRARSGDDFDNRYRQAMRDAGLPEGGAT